MGHSYRRIETRLAGVGDNAVFGSLYVAEHVLKGYEPQVGDDITGTLWLQGEMALDEALLEQYSRQAEQAASGPAQ